LKPSRSLDRAFTARSTSKALLAGLCIIVLLAAFGPTNIAIEITLSLVRYLRILYLAKAANAYDVATQEPDQRPHVGREQKMHQKSRKTKTIILAAGTSRDCGPP